MLRYTQCATVCLDKRIFGMLRYTQCATVCLGKRTFEMLCNTVRVTMN